MISTHILDTEQGRPGRGLKVGLYRDEQLISERETDEDGRIAELSPAPLEAGVYRIVFQPATGFFENPHAERHDKSGLLRDRNELERWNQTV